MYESPIELFTKTVAPKISETLDGMILDAVIAADIKVDRDDLIKALAYDRDQYNKGYEDGKLDASPKWISVEDRLPDMCGMPCLLYGINQYGQGKVFKGFTGYMEHGKHSWHTYCSEDENFAFNVTHWMPLPEPPKED